MLQFRWMVKVTYTFRKGNKITDELASIAFSKPSGKYFFMQSPDEILMSQHDDYFKVI